MEKRQVWMTPFLCLTLVIVSIIAIMMGSVSISVADVVSVISSKLQNIPLESHISLARADIIWEIRLPRVILAAFIGAGLALSGTIMQASVQNPLAEPFILGIASGASVGAVLAILLHFTLGTPLMAFIGAMIATGAVLYLAGRGSKISTVKLVLAGAVISALCTALANFIIYMASDAEGMQSAAFWSMGSLADAKWHNLYIPVLIVSVMGAYFLSQTRTLDALLLGEETALSLGIDASRKRKIYMALIAILTGILVSQCGIIGFVGLVIPHGVRSIVGATHGIMLPVAVLGGAIFLVLADLLSRVLLPSGDLPIGIITALLGSPLFIKLLFGQSK